MADTSTPTPDRAVSRELRKIRRAHRGLLERPDAVAQMHRLAALRCRFAELMTLVEAGGGAGPQNLELVAEARQTNRACSAIERELKAWWALPTGAVDPFSMMAAVRRQLLGPAQQRPDGADGGVIDGVIEAPIGAQLLRTKREQN